MATESFFGFSMSTPPTLNELLAKSQEEIAKLTPEACYDAMIALAEGASFLSIVLKHFPVISIPIELDSIQSNDDLPYVDEEDLLFEKESRFHFNFDKLALIEDRYYRLLALTPCTEEEDEDYSTLIQAYQLAFSADHKGVIARITQEMQLLTRIAARAEEHLSQQRDDQNIQEQQALTVQQPVNSIISRTGVCPVKSNPTLNCLSLAYHKQFELLAHTYEQPEHLLKDLSEELDLTLNKLISCCLDVIDKSNYTPINRKYREDICTTLAELLVMQNGKETKLSLLYRCSGALEHHSRNSALTTEDLAPEVVNEATELINEKVPLLTNIIMQANAADEATGKAHFERILAVLRLTVGPKKTLPSTIDLGKLLPQTRPSLLLTETEILALAPYQIKILTPEHCHRYASLLMNTLDPALGIESNRRDSFGSDETNTSNASNGSVEPSNTAETSESNSSADDSVEIVASPEDMNRINFILKLVEQSEAYFNTSIEEGLGDIIIGNDTIANLLTPSDDDSQYRSQNLAIAEQLQQYVQDESKERQEPSSIRALVEFQTAFHGDVNKNTHQLTHYRTQTPAV